jgi:hypothetical protein
MLLSAVKDLCLPVYLFLAGHDRVIDNGATLEMLGPLLHFTVDMFDPVTTYQDAHHILEFQANPSEYFSDLHQSLHS